MHKKDAPKLAGKTSITMSVEATDILQQLCQLDTRSPSNMIEVLIKAEGKKRGIKAK